MQACERDEPQRACLEAGRHICGTRLAFTLPINRETHCPGCESVSNAEQYCKAHASNVTLEEVQAIFADADTSQAPKAGAAPLTDAELEYFREWAARFNSPMATWVNIPPPPIQVNTRSLLATIDADRVELSRLRRIESRAKEQIAHHVNKPDLPHSTAYYTARFILKGTFVLVDDVLAAIGET